MLKSIKKTKGFTLIEIILALAILSIIIIAMLNLFSFSLMSVFSAGNKSRLVSDLDGIAQNIKAQANISKFTSQTSVETYLETTLGFNKKNSSNLMSKDSGKDINFVVERQQVSGTTTYGYTITLVKFYGNKNDSSKITFFIAEGGL